MEFSKSSLADSNIEATLVVESEGLRGRKSNEELEAENAKDMLLEETNAVVSDDDADTTESVDTDTDFDDSDEESDDEEGKPFETLLAERYHRSSCFLTEDLYPDEEWEEYKQILMDARKLKTLASYHLHPEAPVKADGFATARCFFDRFSAPQEEDADEHAKIMEDMAALKKLAVDFMHPELPVVTTDPYACGRNYFTRPSAPEQVEDADEHAKIMEDLAALKKLAVDFMHPELPVVTTDPYAWGRNYFTRPSASQQEDSDLAAEREQVLADAKALGKWAEFYAHPEKKVETDAFAGGRNYFSRPGTHIHDYMVHTFPAHEEDEHEDDHHMEHFGMDEDHMFDEMREEFGTMQPAVATQTMEKGSDDEGNLSRSPSSVMLFTGESAYD